MRETANDADTFDHSVDLGCEWMEEMSRRRRATMTRAIRSATIKTTAPIMNTSSCANTYGTERHPTTTEFDIAAP
jgi:hypothetical protein